MKRVQCDKGVFLAKPRRRRGVLAFLRNSAGVTAVEFAMIGVPFLALLCAIFQTGLVYFEDAILQETTQVASRAILTQAASGSMTYGTFLSTYVCPPTAVLFNCAAFRMDIQSSAAMTWANADTYTGSANFYANAANTQATTIAMPAAGDIAVVRIMYPLSQMAAIVGGTALRAGSIGTVSTGQANNVSMLLGVYAFRVEP